MLGVEEIARLVFHRRHVHHAVDPRFVSEIGKQRAQELIEIDGVRLGAPGAAIDRDARRIDLVIGHALVSEPAMQPVRIEAGFMAGNDAIYRSPPPSCAPLSTAPSALSNLLPAELLGSGFAPPQPREFLPCAECRLAHDPRRLERQGSRDHGRQGAL